MIECVFAKCSGNFMALILLTMTILFVQRNPVLTKQKSRFYISVSLIVIFLILNEILLTFIETAHNPSFYIADIIGNILGFTLTPTSTILIGILFDEHKEKTNFILLVPIIFNAALTITTPWTGLYFTISPDCIYQRGFGHWIFVIHTAYAILVFSSATVSNLKKYEKKDRPLILLLVLITALGFAMQMAYSELIIGWGCVSISISLNYMLIRELKYGYDPLTGMQTRILFQKKMAHLKKTDNAFIIIFDINNLKNVNDSYGHLNGDKLITDTANIITDNFGDKATAYRIGGDEFCVITKGISYEEVDSILLNIDAKIKQHPPIYDIPFSIAYGYATYDGINDGNAYDCFSIADSLMYLNKKFIKEKKD